MIRSIIKMMWKRKKNNRSILSETFVSFMLLFALFAIILKIWSNHAIPLGYNTENVWVLFIDPEPGLINNEDSILKHEIYSMLINEIRTLPEVVDVSKNSYNIPYYDIYRSDLKYKEKICRNVKYAVSDYDYPNVLNVKLVEGRWFDNYDPGRKEIPIVINSALKKSLFDDESAIDKVIQSGLYKVTGVLENFKFGGEFEEDSPAFFIMMKPEENPRQILIKSTPDANESFRARLIKQSSALAKDWSFTAERLTDARKARFRVNWMPVIIISSICGFLILNVMLGLMGLLWYNINHRKAEVGLRKSVGAPTSMIIRQFTAEMLVLATLGIIPGLILAIQFPLLHVFEIKPWIYITAILCSLFILFLLTVISAFLPATRIARIQPAEALHEK